MKKINMQGVYAIRNICNGKIYIGSARNIKERWRKHRKRLKAGTHNNSHLLESWQKHGKDCFVFGVVELCAEESLIEKETKWIKFYNSIDRVKGYNYVLPDTGEIMRERKNQMRIPIAVVNVITKEEIHCVSIYQAIKKFSLVETKVSKCLKHPFGRYKHRGFYFKKL